MAPNNYEQMLIHQFYADVTEERQNQTKVCFHGHLLFAGAHYMFRRDFMRILKVTKNEGLKSHDIPMILDTAVRV
jgi:hypothetical protein